ncbi:fimbrial protein [Variovorax saccharolyticus]|uniref:fimbrial protein n=1 Tax=Variovorax saccharolyticus TaxID=3053516 RepID=UPI0025754C12|nr:fimbrial protein [Variovorax sp. J31P216]MDM0023763.1 fimbrial protein [Variovorax sp. J31P216]
MQALQLPARAAAVRLCAGLALLALSAAAQAAIRCDYRFDNPYGPAPAVLPQSLLVQALTVGRDVPDGTVIYQQLTDLQPFSLSCDGGAGSVELRSSYAATPRPLASWNTGPHAGKVYESGLPGIGVFIEDLSSGAALPAVRNLPIASLPASVTGKQAQLRLNLIKIGPVSPGAVGGSQLPSAEVAIAQLPLLRLQFLGGLQIVSQTCTTPDVNVSMGTHRTSEFSGLGSATEWKPFEIRLENCPAFHGASASATNTHTGGSGWVFSGTTATNQIGYALTSTTRMIGAPAQGIVALGAARRGGSTAGGIGLQLGRPDGSPHGFDSRHPSGIVPHSEPGAGYAIPLAARYVQTEAAVTPGEANASIIFTIDYQ